MTPNQMTKEDEIPELGKYGLREFKSKVKFGDIIINGYASVNTPGREGIFIKISGNTIECTDGKGYFYKPILDTSARLKIKAGYSASHTSNGLLEAVTLWAFREGWNERARMTGVNKKALDRQYYERQRIIIENKHYEKAVTRFSESASVQASTVDEKDNK